MNFINGIMLDPSRLLESRDIYKQLIPLIAEFGYNTIFWHFTDDHGCMVKLPSHPELASRNAYSVKEMQAFIQLAEQYQLQVIPELECFGHAGYITSKKQYQHLKDGAGKAVFGAITPFHADTQQILSDLIKDCADIFNCPFIHAGLDEVGFGDNPHSAKYLNGRKKWQAFAEHTNWLNQEIKKHGKQMLMWGDHLLGSTNMHDAALDNEALDPRIADLIEKDIVICDWHYDAEVDSSSLNFLREKGFSCIACPSSMAHGSMVNPRQRNIDNIARFSKAAHKKSNTHVLGMMNTVWCPFRYFTGTTLYAMAFAGQRQVNIIKDNFAEEFLKSTFGLRGKGLAQAFEQLHLLMPDLRHHYQMIPGNLEDLNAWTFEAFSQERVVHLQKAITTILLAETKVKKNAAFYKDICVSLSITHDTLGRRDELLPIIDLIKSTKTKATLPASELKKSIRQNCTELQRIYKQTNRHRKAAEQCWRKTRFWDDPKRTGKHKQYRYHDCLLQRLYNHEAYIKKLLQQLQMVMSGA